MSQINLDLDSELAQHLKANVSQKLQSLNINEDSNYVAEFLLVLISNNRTPVEIVQEFSALFGDVINEDFVQGVFNEIYRLQQGGAPSSSEDQQQQQQQGQQEQPQEQLQLQPSQIIEGQLPSQFPQQQPQLLPQQPQQQVHFMETESTQRLDNSKSFGLPGGPRFGASRGGISKGFAKGGRKNFAFKNPANFMNAMDKTMSNDGSAVNFVPPRKAAPRCQFFPHCKERNCQFAHPTKPCFAFPNCPNPPGTCNYLHPVEDAALIAEYENVKRNRMNRSQNNNNHSISNQVSKEIGRQLQQQSGIVLCKFGAVCQKELCPFGHPTPASKDAKVTILQWCPENKDCQDPKCQKAHSSPNFTPENGAVTGGAPNKPERSLEQCKFATYCKNKKCLKRHATSPVLCREGANCTRVDCYFQHPIDDDCRFGVNCRNANCAFKHPEGRELNAGKSNMVWVNNPKSEGTNGGDEANNTTSERQFAVPDDQVMEQAPIQEA